MKLYDKKSTKLDPKIIYVHPLKENHEIPLALTYDDILLRPKRGSIRSRRDVSTRTKLTNKITLNSPIISANMDTVTESRMAIAVARMGGIGIIHRFMTYENQIKEVSRVKNDNMRDRDDLLTVNQTDTLASAWRLMDKTGIQSVLVTDNEHRLVGILTARDIIFEDNPSRKVSELMTSKKDLITAPIEIESSEATKILKKHKIEKLPLIDGRGRLKGLITASDLIKEKEFPYSSRDEAGRFLVGAAIGVRGDYLERAAALLAAGADVLVLDIAHGHSDQAIEAVSAIKNKLKTELIAGNVATADGVRDLLEAGADAVKVGVGPGSACTTRVVAGVGMPQFSAIIECVQAAKQFSAPIIADGGIRSSGDIVKALAAGASSVMIGNLFAGTSESPGDEIIRDGKKFKLFRGMASIGAGESKLRLDGATEDDWFNREVVPEGVEAALPHKGSVINLIYQLIGGLRSGMSYLNAHIIPELAEDVDFVRITNAGLSESHPHDLS